MDLSTISTILSDHKRTPFININGTIETVGCNYARFAQLPLIKSEDCKHLCCPGLVSSGRSPYVNIIDCNNEYPIFYESYYGRGTYYNSGNHSNIRSYVVLTNMGNIYIANPNEEYYTLYSVGDHYVHSDKHIGSNYSRNNGSYGLIINNPNPQVYEDINIVPKLFVDVLSTFLKTKINGKDNGAFKKLCVDYMEGINSYKDTIRTLRCTIDKEILELKGKNEQLIDENVELVNKNLILEETIEKLKINTIQPPQQEHLSCCNNMSKLYTENICLKYKIELLEKENVRLTTENKLLSIRELF